MRSVLSLASPLWSYSNRRREIFVVYCVLMVDFTWMIKNPNKAGHEIVEKSGLKLLTDNEAREFGLLDNTIEMKVVLETAP